MLNAVQDNEVALSDRTLEIRALARDTRAPFVQVSDECLFTVSDFRGYGLGGAALVEHKIVKAIAFALLRSEGVGMFA